MVETLIKGKAGQIGEIRVWGGKKYQKTAKGWRPVAAQHAAPHAEPKPAAPKKTESEKDKEIKCPTKSSRWTVGPGKELPAEWEPDVHNVRRDSRGSSWMLVDLKGNERYQLSSIQPLTVFKKILPYPNLEFLCAAVGPNYGAAIAYDTYDKKYKYVKMDRTGKIGFSRHDVAYSIYEGCDSFMGAANSMYKASLWRPERMQRTRALDDWLKYERSPERFSLIKDKWSKLDRKEEESLRNDIEDAFGWGWSWACKRNWNIDTNKGELTINAWKDLGHSGSFSHEERIYTNLSAGGDWDINKNTRGTAFPTANEVAALVEKRKDLDMDKLKTIRITMEEEPT